MSLLLTSNFCTSTKRSAFFYFAYLFKYSAKQPDVLNQIRFSTSSKSTIDKLRLFNKAYYYKKCFLCNYTTTSTPSSSYEPTNKRIETNFLARQFIETLTSNERVVIKEELLKYEQEQALLSQEMKANKVIPKPTWKQLGAVGITVGLPFIGFGFVDNFLMIVAGDLIESYIGMFLPISTMAAAGLGNAFSDVAGIGLAHHIEYFCSKLTHEPVLTSEQFSLPFVSWFMVFAKSIAIFLGCVIGMFPLLFMSNHQKESINQEK